jgi:hypothetical protein
VYVRCAACTCGGPGKFYRSMSSEQGRFASGQRDLSFGRHLLNAYATRVPGPGRREQARRFSRRNGSALVWTPGICTAEEAASRAPIRLVRYPSHLAPSSPFGWAADESCRERVLAASASRNTTIREHFSLQIGFRVAGWRLL